ncbi:hypothetical protein VNO80_02450 [Phaseolus coccineus]|uniref:Small ribosomal subunit protein bS18c n=1 Tax=Phaseolus coccineus TaxID=3886 RepID=A0AAN9RHZ7_PHACN
MCWQGHMRFKEKVKETQKKEALALATTVKRRRGSVSLRRHRLLQTINTHLPLLGTIQFGHLKLLIFQVRKKMKIVAVAVRSLSVNLSHQFYQTHMLRSFSTWRFTDNRTGDQQASKSESPEEFGKFGENRGRYAQFDSILEKINQQGIGSDQQAKKSGSPVEFGKFGENRGRYAQFDSIIEKIDQQGMGRQRSGSGNGFGSDIMDNLEENYDTLIDGMDGKLKNAASYFEFDEEEIDKEDYAFRYDANFPLGYTYDTKDLDLTKPGVRKPPIRGEFSVTTKEVLRKADFRNVRFLANFITEAGIIIKRSQTGISAKAQRKVAREIKTARALGLLPFTTMGTKSFVFGKTMESLDEDFAYKTTTQDMDMEHHLDVVGQA